MSMIKKAELNLEDMVKMNTYIKLDHVSKKFGDREVLYPLTVEFEKGKIHGIIGRNGSGKTVMMKLILGILLPTQGEVIVNGKKIGKDVDFPADTGAIIENVEFLSYLNAYQNLENLAAIHQKIGKKEIQEILKIVGLENTGRKKVGKFSLGMRQRLAIAQAIMESPQLIILDEPMNGLDKSGVEEMRRIFGKLRDEGTTMILASHNMEDISCLCDEIYEMDAGVLQKCNTV